MPLRGLFKVIMLFNKKKGPTNYLSYRELPAVIAFLFHNIHKIHYLPLTKTMENWIGAVIDWKWIVKEIIDRFQTGTIKLLKTNISL